MNRNRVPWLAMGLAGGIPAILGAARLLEPVRELLPVCPLKAMTGLPCATCGLTRCVQALAQSNWLEAFHWHPVAVLLLGLVPFVIFWDLKRAWKAAPYPDLPDSLALRLTLIGIFLATWILQVARGI
jgi:hypothetical protein